MSINSKFISLKEYIPLGSPTLSNFSLNTKKIHLENNDDVLVKNEWISVDPYMRARMTERKNYLDEAMCDYLLPQFDRLDRETLEKTKDAAESLGAVYNGQKCGSFGEMAILSFNGNKIITTSGGCMLLSNKAEYIEVIQKVTIVRTL